MSRYMDDIALTQRRDELKSELEQVEEKIKTIPKIKEIFEKSYHENLKTWIKNWGDWQELHIEYDIDKEDGVWFSRDEFEKIYDFGWHIVNGSVNMDRFELILRRNAE